MTSTRFTPTPLAAAGLALHGHAGIYPSAEALLYAIAPEAPRLHPGAGPAALRRWRLEVLLAVEPLLDGPDRVRCAAVLRQGTVPFLAELQRIPGVLSFFAVR